MFKMKFTDNQVAFDYVIYMITSSYFNKATCTNSLLETKMRLQYWEQKPQSQYNMEDICIRYVEKKLFKVLPDELWNREVKVKIISKHDTGCEIMFVGPECTLKVMGEYKGKKTKLFYMLEVTESVMRR